MATFLTLVKTWWPIISFAISMLSGMHAASAKTVANSGGMSIESQATHVGGAGGLAAATFIAGVAGIATNHKAAVAAPSKPAPGVDPIAHELGVLHTILVENGGNQGEFDKLKEMVVGRVVKSTGETKP